MRGCRMGCSWVFIMTVNSRAQRVQSAGSRVEQKAAQPKVHACPGARWPEQGGPPRSTPVKERGRGLAPTQQLQGYKAWVQDSRFCGPRARRPPRSMPVMGRG